MSKLLYTFSAAVVSVAAGLVGAAVTPSSPQPASASAAPAINTATAPQPTKQQLDFFEAKVRPILSANCYNCHSIESGKAKGKLTLDTREGLLKGGDNGPEITPGDPDQSRLIRAISYNDPDLQMPPKGEKLGPQAIADLTTWVKMGAADPRTSTVATASKLTGLTDKARAHWAYQPVKQPAVPQVKNAAWVRMPVDNFVLAKLEQNGMRPNALANKESLIRRATFDLIGLPPTPEEVQAFVGDASPDAFEKVVDRLLASPHYGERWGRFWLDSARYSDTSGAEGNVDRRNDYRYAHAWTYRDYVIQAFNDDKPYDQFLREQIAADLLPTAKENPATLAALGFLTVGKRFANPNDQIDERIDALGKATQGITIACARCHDHKFDPIPTEDYYSLHGIFLSTIEPEVKPLLAPEPTTPEYTEFKKQLADIETHNRQIYFDLLATKSIEFRKKASAYLQVGLYGRKNAASELRTRNKLIADNNLDRDLYQGGFRAVRKGDPVFGPLLRFAEIPPEAFADKAKDALAEVTAADDSLEHYNTLRAAEPRDADPRRVVRVKGAKGFGMDNRQSIARRINPLVVRAFKAVDPESIKSLKDVADVYGKLFIEHDGDARAYLEACRTATTPVVKGFDAAVVDLAEEPTPIDPAPLITTDHLREISPLLPVVNQGAYQKFSLSQINELLLTHPAAPARAMVVADAPNPRDSAVMIRGEALNRGPIVPRRYLEIIAGKDRKNFTQGSGRLQLADAIASRDNPLTARVMMNRFWMHHFGEAFVRTPDDLGVQSEAPSHPELLDYLSARFVQGGWSLKKMHKLVMLSSAYRQSSMTNPAYANKDPDNRLLWRANLRRLDFEAIRDAMLQFTGKLDHTIGGKPVNLTDEPYSNRRSVYGYIDRGDLPELMAQFDFADPDMANSRRVTTIVPSQALFFMNSPMTVDVVRKVTTRPEFVNAADDNGKVQALYEVLFQRPAKPEEVAFATEYLNDAKSQGVAVDAKPRADVGNMKAGKQAKAGGYKGNGRQRIHNEGDRVVRRPLTVWEQYAQALLFTNEIAYVN